MSFNKTKAMRNAERYLTQGKIEAAIREYERIVEQDPRDFNTQNMLGDLYTKADCSDAAIDCYRLVAGHYHKQGFAKKAIAIYNKIYRLRPGSIEVLSKLAELYHVRGSLAEARNHYRDLAERLVTDGRESDAHIVWEKIAEIDPGDSDICLKLAEVHSRQKNTDEACNAYYEAGTRLAEKGKNDEASKAFRRALDTNENHWKAVRGFVRSNIVLGSPEKAALVLEQRLEKDPHNQEQLFLLIDCYFEMNAPADAEKAIIKLVEREPANYPKLLELVDVYLANEDIRSSVRILSMTADHLLAGGDSEILRDHLNKVLSKDPRQLEALRLLARHHGWQREPTQLQATLEKLADAAKEANSPEDERYALAQFLRIAPHDTRRAARLEQLNKEYDFDDDPVDGKTLLRDVPKSIDTETENSGANGLDAIGERFALESEREFDATAPENAGFFAVSNGRSNGSNARNVNEKADPPDSRVVVEEPGVVTVIEDGVRVVDENTNGARMSMDQAGAAAEPKADDEPLSPSQELRLDEELESIRFYIDQGYETLADKTLTELENEFGNRTEIVALRSDLGDIRGGQSAVGDLPGATDGSDENEPETATRDAAPVSTPVREIEKEPEKEPSGRKEVESTLAEAGTIDTGDPLDELRREMGLDESSREPAVDYETHYHTAVAYKEMGLTEAAIREFQAAVNCVEPAGEARRFLNCCEMLGHCFVEKEMPKLALTWFERALKSEGLNGDEKLALRYEIGNVYELSGRPEDAIGHFEEVYAVDVDFRDVAERLEALRGRLNTAA